MKRIAYVDDDRFWAKQRVIVLEQTFKVEYFREAQSFVDFVRTADGLDAVVVDMMMPPPASVDPQDVADGVETGMWVLETLDDFVRNYPLPFIFVSNVEDHRFLKLTERIKAQKFPKGLVQLYRKLDFGPQPMVELLERLIERFRGK